MNITVTQSDTPEHKREAWKQIQQYPDFAEFVNECHARFGKLEVVSVEVDATEDTEAD